MRIVPRAAAAIAMLAVCSSALAQPTPDLNANGMTDLLDLQLFTVQFGLTGEPLTIPADLDMNGLVDIADFVLLQHHITGPTEDPCDPSLCYDEDPCTLDICVFGDCQNVPIPECCSRPIQCMDGDVCTQDICLAFRCINPPLECTPRDCDDGIECTLDKCICGSCAHLPYSLACDDGILCTRDECLEGLGCTNVPDDSLCPNHEDSDADCIHDYCLPRGHPDPRAPGCVPGAEFGTPCDDGIPCTTYDYCDSGFYNCIGTAPDSALCPNQDDDDADCIKYFCLDWFHPDPRAPGCVQGAESGTPCDDGDACTAPDRCDQGLYNCTPGPRVCP